MMESALNKIHESYLFSSLPREQFEKTFANSSLVNYKKGEVIYKQDSFATHAYYLADGFAKVYVEHKRQLQVVNVIKPLWFIDLFSNFSYEKHRFSAKTITDAKVLLIDKKMLEKLFIENKDFAFRYIKALSLLGTDISRFLALLNKKNVRGRIAEILFHLSQNIYRSSQFQLGFTRQEIGDLANTSTETVIRIISEFKNEGIINQEQKDVMILDIEKLKDIIEIST